MKEIMGLSQLSLILTGCAALCMLADCNVFYDGFTVAPIAVEVLQA